MSIFKCKMCGGTIEFEQGATVGVCDSCGTKQTLPRLDDDKKANLYDRANHFRRNNDFDKAMGIYEKILNEDKTDAEAYWSLVLCRYGIEYVEDPATHRRVPTVNRAQFTSIYMDENYKSAIQYADDYQRQIYEAEAKSIDEIQKGILEISNREEPFDVFICYKETDAQGRRTPDSVLATELYHELTKEGFKVFFSRITLEDKLGAAYEPYIFAALNSARVMVAIGTKPEYFNAVWVKNEWSRYLALIKNGAKKMLIPAYRDMDPYDLPEEFSHLQAQDMSKLGFMQDLIRGIKKVIGAEDPTPVRETVVVQSESSNVQALLDRGFLALEDGDWTAADGFFEQALNFDAKLGKAYLGKLLADLKVKKQEQLADCAESFEENSNYQKALRFGDAQLVGELKGYIAAIQERNAQDAYAVACELMKTAKDEQDYAKAAAEFETLADYQDAAVLATQCREKAVEIKQETERKAEEKRIAAEKAAKKRKKIIAITTPIVCVCIAFIIVLNTVIIPKVKYARMTDYKSAAVGDHIYFGTYEQDNNTSNGKEDIEWLVLAKEDNKLLVISDKALDCQEYNTSFTDVTWETCSLRKWMNGTFLNDAFGADEQAQIQSTTVSADKNPNYSTNPGNATNDKVFLLSITEAEKYFLSNEDRKCVPTEYAIAQVAWTSDSHTKGSVATCGWWLRSPGSYQNNAAVVNSDGSVYYYGVNSNNVCVRPAMWISVGD